MRSDDPNAPPTIGVDDAHVRRRQPEAPRDLVALVADPLRLAPQRQPVARPCRDGRMRLHRVVLLAAEAVAFIERDGRARERALGVALARLRAALLLRRRFGGRLGERGIEAQLRRRVGVVGRADQRRAVFGLRLRPRDDERDRLAAEQDRRPVEHAELRAGHRVDRDPLGGLLIGQTVGVEMGEDEQHARRVFSGARVERGDRSGGASTVGGRSVEEAVGRELGGVLCLAAHLRGSVDARERRSHRAHVAASPSMPVSSIARATVLRTSSIL